jgi:hypothetical protein
VLYDACHHYVILKSYLGFEKVYVLTDGLEKFVKMYSNEMKRLVRKGVLKKEVDLNVGHLFQVDSRKKFFDEIHNLTDHLKDMNVYFALASHGYSGLPDHKGTESDGRNEYIRIGGDVIVDDELFDNFVSRIDVSVNMFMIADTCQSASIYDLSFAYNIDHNRYYKENNSEAACNCIAFGACLDSQFNSDTLNDYVGFSGGFSSVILSYIIENSDLNIKNFVQFIKKHKTQGAEHVVSYSKNIHKFD